MIVNKMVSEVPGFIFYSFLSDCMNIRHFKVCSALSAPHKRSKFPPKLYLPIHLYLNQWDLLVLRGTQR